MTYTLGVDLGTTFTAASIDDGSGPVPLTLGNGTAAMPSVVAIRDGEPVTGEAAEEQLRTAPASGVRDAKRRLGDSTPFILDGTPYGAEALMGLLLADVIEVATEQRGEAPTSVVLTHPANWGNFKKDLLSDTARVAGLEDVGLISEPQAAALHYVRSGELQPGQAAAVYDFGGGTFDAAVVRCAEDGPQLVGEAKGLERLGGIDLDQAILMHVNNSLDGALRELDPSDPAAAAAMAAVRTQCVAAKEALSSASEATISVALPTLTTSVRLTRPEFEEMLRPRIADTLAQLDAALASADLAAKDLSAVVVVGGTSRIPLVGEMVAAHTGVPVVASADHKTVVCAGAAAGDAPAAADLVAATALADPAAVAEGESAGVTAGGGSFVVTGPAASPESAAKYRGGVTKRRLAFIGGATVLAAGAIVGGAAAAGATPADALDKADDLKDDAMGQLGFGGNGSGGGGTPHLETAHLDEFDVPAAPASGGPGGPGAPAGGGAAPHGGGGGSPMARAAGMGHRGPPAHHAAPAHHAPAHHAPPSHTPPGHDAPEHGGGPMGPAGGHSGAADDPQFAQGQSALLQSLQGWHAPPGVDPETAAEFKADLLNDLQRFHPMPGESPEHALAALQQEYQQHVVDFVKDQHEAGIITQVQMQQAQDAAVQQQVDSVRDALLNGLDHYPAPKGMETNFYDFRTEVQKVLRQYQPKPGESADEALAALRSQYEDRVGTAGRAANIPIVADDLAKADDAGNSPITVVDGPTTITYGPAYRDHATNPPQEPSRTDNGDGTSTVSFIDQHGRQVTIVSSELPKVALDKYRAEMPPLPPEPPLSPEAIARMEDHRQQPTWPDHQFDPTKFGYQGPGGYLDAAHQHLGFPPMTPLLTAQANGTDTADAGATGTSDGPPADGDADTTAAAAAQVAADDDVVGDTDDATSDTTAGAADADGDDGPEDDATGAAGAGSAVDHQAGDDLDEFSTGSTPSSDDDDVVGDTDDTPASPSASRDSDRDDDDDHDASAQQPHSDEPDPFATQEHDDDPFATPAHHEDDDDAFAMPKQDSGDEFDSGGDDSHGGDSDSHDDSHEPDDHDFD